MDNETKDGNQAMEGQNFVDDLAENTALSAGGKKKLIEVNLI